MTKRQKEYEQFITQVLTETGQLEKLRQEGAVQGIRQTKLETARNALAEGLQPATIQRITGLSRETIESLAARATT
jgi:predicted transposase/invertase (TIGR01784 family)